MKHAKRDLPPHLMEKETEVSGNDLLNITHGLGQGMNLGPEVEYVCVGSDGWRWT